LAARLIRFRWPVIAVAIVLTAVAALGIPELFANIRVNRGALQNPDEPVRVRYEEVVHAFGTPLLGTIVLEGRDAETMRRTADEIAAALTPAPSGSVPTTESECRDPARSGDLVKDVFYKVDIRAFEERGIYYLSAEDLAGFADAIESADPATGARGWMPPFEGLQAMIDAIAERFETEGTTGGEGEDAKQAQGLDALGEGLDRLARWLDAPYPEERLGESAAPKLSEEDRRGIDEKGYLAQGTDPIRMVLLVRPLSDSEDEKDNRCFVRMMRSVAHGVARRVSGETGTPVRALVTGMPAAVADEMALIATDASRVALYSGILILALILAYYRSFRTTAIVFVPLVLGLVWTLGVVDVTIGRLTLITTYFGGVLLGLGIDYAVQVVQRYNDELLNGCTREEAMARTLGYTGSSILTASATTLLAFIGVGITDFLGFAELGQISAIGVGTILLASLTVLPVVLHLLYRPRAQGMTLHLGMERVLRRRGARLAVIGFTAAVVLAGGAALSRAYLDWDAMRLLPDESESVQGARALADTDFSADIVMATAPTPEAAAALGRDLEALAKPGASAAGGEDCADQRPTVSRVESLERYERFLPPMSLAKVDQVLRLKDHKTFLARIQAEAARAAASPPAISVERVIEVLQTIGGKAEDAGFFLGGDDPDSALAGALKRFGGKVNDLADRIRAGERAAMQARLQGFQGWFLSELAGGLELVVAGLSIDPKDARALPPQIAERFRSKDGTAHAVYVHPSRNAADRDFLPCFVADVYSVDPGATGFPMTHLVNAVEIERSFRNATIYAFLGVLLAIGFHMRRISHVLVTLLPLLFGATLVVGIQYLAGMPFNFVNVMALPVLIGTGVDYGVYLVGRYREDPTATEGFASTSSGITLCALSTIIGFGTLMISDHNGMWSLGFSLSIGILGCLFAAQFAIPAILHARAPKKG
jgi:predicted exporter